MKKIYIILCVGIIITIIITSILITRFFKSNIKSPTLPLPPQNKPIDIELKFEEPNINEPDIDNKNIYKSDTSVTPNCRQPVEPTNYPGLIIPSIFGTWGKGSLFYIGKIEYEGILKSIQISGSFTIGDGIPSRDSFYTIIILPPSGKQQDFLDEDIRKSIIGDKFDFSTPQKFLKKMDNLNTEITKNSVILLYIFGSKASSTQIGLPIFTIFNPKILLNMTV
jgi:hypothetical protein